MTYWISVNLRIASTGQLRIVHRSLSVVVVIGLFLRSLSIVELEMPCLFIKVYVDSDDALRVAQNGS